MNWAELIHRDASILGGKPVFRGTRISVEQVLRHLAAKWSQNDLLENYPTLRADHIAAALAYAADAIGEDDPILRYTLKKIRMNIPPEVPLALVHGDLQPGNFLLSEGSDPYIIDWEFARIGDPRLDLGYYLQIPMPPHLYHPDPEAFVARYRELTGMTEEQINPAIARYFLLLGTSHLMLDILRGTEDVTSGQHRGIMGTFLMTAYAHFHKLYLDYALELPYSEEAS